MGTDATPPIRGSSANCSSRVASRRALRTTGPGLATADSNNGYDPLRGLRTDRTADLITELAFPQNPAADTTNSPPKQPVPAGLPLRSTGLPDDMTTDW